MNVHTPRMSTGRFYLLKTLRSHAKVRFFLTLLVTCTTLTAGAILWSVKAHKPATGRNRLLVSTADDRLGKSLNVTKNKNFAAPVAMMVPLTGGGSITTFGSPLIESFDTLAQTGVNIAWTDDSTLSGGYSSRTTYNSGTGSSNTGALYSFGVAGANPVTDRALGGVGSGGTGTFYYAFKLTNNTGFDINSLLITYNGEQWRDGGAATPVAQTTTFQYQVGNAGTVTDANSPATGWTTFSALSFTSPTFTNTSTGAALDGNTAANHTAKSAVLSLPMPATNGQEIWIRWEDINDVGNDHGLAIDDLSITAGTQEVSVAVSPAAVNEDEAVDLVYTFTRTDPAGSLVVDFSVSGTAIFGTDYTQTGATTFTATTGSVTFANGSPTAVINVITTADTDFELDDTVILTVTSGTGYSAGTPASATGTITNDDAVPFELVVNTTDDNDDELCDSTHCSLREAIDAANLDFDFNFINFDIPLADSGHVYYADNDGAGVSAASVTPMSTPGTIDPDWPHSWWRITPGSGLPEITTSVALDGYTQRPCLAPTPAPCSQENTEPAGNNAILLIELDGSAAGGDELAQLQRKAAQAAGDGLVITEANGAFSTIMGLVINKFAGNGILLQGGGGNTIRGNFIGTDVSGTLAAGNAVGLRIEDNAGNQVGCEVAEERNIISGNVDDGVQIAGIDSYFNAIQGNFIGTGRDGSVIGNGGAGVEIDDAPDNTVGAFPPFVQDANRLDKRRKSAPGCAACCRTKAAPGRNVPQVDAPPGNVIAGNGGAGVAVTTIEDGVNNLISENSIFDNVGLGIDLGDDGVTPNDVIPCDEDDGANHLQNFPIVTSAFSDGGTTTIQFTLNAPVDEEVTVEFFTNSTVDPSGNGEGQIFIDSTTVTISAEDCSETFSFNTTGELTPGLFVSATATDFLGNTSEFGPNQMVTSPTAANSTISGAIVDDQGVGVAGVVINLSGTQNRRTITNAKGAYFFDAVEASGFYTVTPARANYSFSPGLRSFNQLGNHTEAGFSASRAGDVTNPLDTAEFFVRQQYVDILGREPDEGGFNYWSNEINRCGSDAACVNARRRDIAAAFFIEQEFQQSGSYIYNLYSGALGRKPRYAEYAGDRRQVVGGANLEAEKASFAARFVQRADFLQRYQGSTTADSFVEALLQTVQQSSGVDLSGQRASLVSTYGSGANIVESRSLVLRQVANNSAFRKAEYNAAFVLTEYFGYLKRDPEQGGFDFWLNVLNNREPGNFRGMVCSFITSTEYQQRFSQVVTHSNAECGP